MDHNYIFHDIYIGWPGSVHDACVFAHSSLYKKATVGSILNGANVQIQSQDISPFLIGDSAYSLLPWLMKPFPHNVTLSDPEKRFNYIPLIKGSIVVENAFGRLKARWRRLLKQNEMSVRNVPSVIHACCILHNMLEIRKEMFIESWLDQCTVLAQPTSRAVVAIRNNRAKRIRDALVHYF